MSLTIKPGRDALVIVDLQPTFFPADPQLPGSGELPVPTAPSIVPPILKLLPSFPYIVATRDAHPRDHLSFASQFSGKKPFDVIEAGDLDQLRPAEGAEPYDSSMLKTYLGRVKSQTLWPDHGRRDTPGGVLHPELPHGRLDAVIPKGENRYFDSYSAFFDNGRFSKTALDDLLRIRQIRRLFIAGLALDVCVCYTVLDALSLEYDVVVLEDCCAALEQPEGAASTAWQQMTKRGAIRARSTDLTSAPQ